MTSDCSHVSEFNSILEIDEKTLTIYKARFFHVFLEELKKNYNVGINFSGSPSRFTISLEFALSNHIDCDSCIIKTSKLLANKLGVILKDKIITCPAISHHINDSNIMINIKISSFL